MSHERLYHTVLRMDLSGTTPYERHQRVAALVSKDRTAPRDYLFAVSDDEQEVYVRSPEPRIDVSGWREMELPQQGQIYRIGALVWADVSKFSEQYRNLWRIGFGVDDRIKKWFSDACDVTDLTFSFQPSVEFGKPRMKRVFFTPVRVSARAHVRDAKAAARIAAQGIGHGKAFGYGCVFFSPDQ
jgi:hypothetical protein